MGKAGRHQARGRWWEVLARHRWHAALGTGAGIAALACASVIISAGDSPDPAAAGCEHVTCTATRPAVAGASAPADLAYFSCHVPSGRAGLLLHHPDPHCGPPLAG